MVCYAFPRVRGNPCRLWIMYRMYLQMVNSADHLQKVQGQEQMLYKMLQIYLSRFKVLHDEIIFSNAPACSLSNAKSYRPIFRSDMHRSAGFI